MRLAFVVDELLSCKGKECPLGKCAMRRPSKLRKAKGVGIHRSHRSDSLRVI